jgi:hypothetical protein
MPCVICGLEPEFCGRMLEGVEGAICETCVGICAVFILTQPGSPDGSPRAIHPMDWAASVPSQNPVVDPSGSDQVARVH